MATTTTTTTTNNNNNLYNTFSLVGAMDRVWFHQPILISNPNNTSIITPQTLEELSSLNSQSSSFSTNSSSLDDEDISSDQTISPPRINIPKKEVTERLKRKSDSFNNSGNRSRSTSTRLEKSMSCKSLRELELEEVKGFLDLGFRFKKEHLSPRMMSLIPGLQRINSMSKNKGPNKEEEEVINEEDEKSNNAITIRPYLSEAWLIRRPSSPLLNLKVPKVSQASDMKKHLRFWARTVASEIQHESYSY